MNFVSTRNAKLTNESVSPACAIKRGLAINGGLYMPGHIPTLTKEDLEAMRGMTYPQVAAKIISMYLSDYTYEELLEDAEKAYSEEKFPEGAIGIREIEGGRFFLELWHGPTCAFKDMALQIMPRLLSRALKKTAEDREAVILVATSGDTGKAALEGYCDVPGINIEVFYPAGGVSKVQELQMVTQKGNNVNVAAVNGNFDDAQTEVKRIFIDKAFVKEMDEKGYFLTSANSINFGRLVPQIVYYVFSYLRVLDQYDAEIGKTVDICVPTGNFGNILAAYMAKQMGLPFRRFVCASNENNILTDFINTGVYDKHREFKLTISPSMDILVSSNLERLLYLIAGDDKVRQWMRDLRSEAGAYTVDAETLTKLQAEFSGYYCSEENTKATIKKYFDTYGYLIDTHTAVAAYCADKFMEENDSNVPMIIASTASPFKFAQGVYGALTGNVPEDAVKALDMLSEISGNEIPAPLANAVKSEVRFSERINVSEMRDSVREFLNK